MSLLETLVAVAVASSSLSAAAALDFDGAVSGGRFADLSARRGRARTVALSQFGGPEEFSAGFALDGAGAFHHADDAGNFSVEFRVAEFDCAQQAFVDNSSYYSYNLELSLTILKLKFGRRTKDGGGGGGGVRVTVRGASGLGWDPSGREETHEVTKERMRPEEVRLERNQHLFRTWPFEYFTLGSTILPSDDACQLNRSIRLDLTDWHPASSSIYFLGAVHKRMRRRFIYSDWSNGCPDPGDFGCEGDVFSGGGLSEHQICVPTEAAACDMLPGCGQEIIPNADESNCGRFPLQRSLRLLVFALCAVALILVAIGCCRSCYTRTNCCRERLTVLESGSRGTRGASPTEADAAASSRLGRRQQQQHQLQHGGFPGFGFPYRLSPGSLPRSRPATAPPTYEDATKNDNPGFAFDEEEDGEDLDGERPPSYRELPPEEVPGASLVNGAAEEEEDDDEDEAGGGPPQQEAGEAVGERANDLVTEGGGGDHPLAGGDDVIVQKEA